MTRHVLLRSIPLHLTGTGSCAEASRYDKTAPSQRYPRVVVEARLQLDADLRPSDDGRTLIGGSPFRLLRLTDAGAVTVGEFAAGKPIPASGQAQALAARLIDAGMAHPLVEPRAVRADEVSVVVPHHNDHHRVARSVESIETTNPGIAITVVDDASDLPPTEEDLRRSFAGAGRPEVRVIELTTNQGPAAARNRGWAAVSSPLVAFVDSDVLVTAGWLESIIPLFDDPNVAAVGPRVQPGTLGTEANIASTALSRYEATDSPLDMGPRPAGVRPRSRVSHLPAAALVVRRSALEAVGGFDESLRSGEDVDLLWRLVEAGYRVRYQPESTVVHADRPTWRALARQRAFYGSAAAPLDARHPSLVSPVDVNVWSLASWAAIALGGRAGRFAGLGLAAGTAAALVPKLRDKVDQPAVEALRLGLFGHLHAGRWIASAVPRAWLPLAMTASLFSRRARRATLAAIALPPLVEWAMQRRQGPPQLDPVRYVGASILDDVSYGVGVWRGIRKLGSLRAIMPRLTGIGGLTAKE